jgi:hypothetical protein
LFLTLVVVANLYYNRVEMRDLQHRLEVGARRSQPLVERPTVLEVESVTGTIARFDAIGQLAAASPAARRSNAADKAATDRRRPAMRLATALAAWEIQAHRTLANQPDAADLVRVAWLEGSSPPQPSLSAKLPRGEARSTQARQTTHPGIKNAQLAWSRSARRWTDLTTSASSAAPALIAVASQLRAAICAAVANPTGWATPDQDAARIDLPATAMTLYRSLVVSVGLANVTREIASDHPGLAAADGVIATRAQGEAEVEQCETLSESGG